MGARVTAVGTIPSAIAATRAALEELKVEANFLQSEKVSILSGHGVCSPLHQLSSALKSIAMLVKQGGLIYMYLYGRECVDFDTDIRIFKDRMAYNYLPTVEQPASRDTKT
jgi:hypothetical protein